MRVQPFFAVGLALLSGCTKARDLSLCVSLGGGAADCSQGAGVHPAGWNDAASPDFHQRYLRANGDKLSACVGCHGADYGGGAVSVSCTSQGCHTQKGGP